MSELYIPIERPQCNPVNGRFLKGHIPHNKGKKMSDYMEKEKIQKVIQVGIKNLKRNPFIGGWNRKAIVALDDEGNILGWFPSSHDAERKTGICRRNINAVCNGKRRKAGGFRWEFC